MGNILTLDYRDNQGIYLCPEALGPNPTQGQLTEDMVKLVESA